MLQGVVIRSGASFTLPGSHKCKASRCLFNRRQCVPLHQRVAQIPTGIGRPVGISPQGYRSKPPLHNVWNLLQKFLRLPWQQSTPPSTSLISNQQLTLWGWKPMRVQHGNIANEHWPWHLISYWLGWSHGFGASSNKKPPSWNYPSA